MTDSPTRSSVQARDAVSAALGAASWTVTALGGSTATAWLAAAPGRSVVVRLDADASVLGRVAQLGIAPPVVASGVVAGRRYVIQEHIDAPSPSSRWLDEHADAAAPLFATLAGDLDLRTFGEPLHAGRWGETLLGAGRAAHLDRSRLDRVERLATEAPAIDVAELVPSHGDPNRTNFLAGGRLILVDWDDFRVSDRMRDLGQFAWWYLAEPRWPSFLEASGAGWNDDVAKRLYWWAAAESLDVALRLLPLDEAAAEGFLLDFDHAVERRANPRRGG